MFFNKYQININDIRYAKRRRTKHSALSVLLVLIFIFCSSCDFMSNKKEIKESFEEKLSMYPIKNLEDFYDKEGLRDAEFAENDKGTWNLYSSMAIKRNHDDNYTIKGMVLTINRNTRKSEGEYFVINKYEDKKGVIRDREKNYPVTLTNNKIIPKKPIEDEKIRREIEDFRFFVQYANFKNLDLYSSGDFDYNPNVPSYSAEYQLTNEDYNVKQLRKRYDIPTDKEPKLILKGVGEFKGSSIGYKNLEINFEDKNGRRIHFADSIDLKPSEDGD
ncbi:tandem-type lipoprotein [Staphylococcus hyicus]|uniref:tandem-type lipoprotein n=1 Tax=Staphylococcus hyicus TaxID=1284 RepID=UPI0036D24396